ncbi:glycosyltransferase [Candidatus Woesearchaeota archaeon]|nr:glycosyltransferase [Candidatus Woesearchaeota archaeon]
MKKILLFTPRQWNLQWGQEKDLINQINTHYKIKVIDLFDYSDLPNTYSIPKNTELVIRKTNTKPGLLLGIKTEIQNAKQALKSDFNIMITYLTAGTILASIISRIRGKKVLLIYADDYPELNRNSSYVGYLLTKYFANPILALMSNKIVATARLLAKDISIMGKKAEKIPNGVHIESYTSDKKIKNNNYTVGFVGGFGEWLDFDLIINAAKKLPAVNFVLVGDGPQFNYVKKQTKQLKNVRLTGMIPKDEVVKEIDSMSVCTIPFKVNRLTDRVSPIKLFEYWAREKPVISTSFLELKETGENIVEFADSKDDFLNKILLLENLKLRNEIGEKGKKEVKKYDWSSLGKRYLKILGDL